MNMEMRILNLSRAILACEDENETGIFIGKLSSWCKKKRIKLFDFDFPYQPALTRDGLPNLLRDDVEDPKNTLLFITVKQILDDDHLERLIEFANKYVSFRVFICCEYNKIKLSNRVADFVPIKWGHVMITHFNQPEEDDPIFIYDINKPLLT